MGVILVKLARFISKVAAFFIASVLVTTGITQMPTFAELNSNDSIDACIKNLVISSKDSQRILGKFDIINNSNSAYADLYCASEVYLTSENGTNLINKVINPVTLLAKETKKIDLNHVFPTTLYKGDYILIVRLYNRAALPISLEYNDLGTLGIDKNYLIINTDNCFIINNNQELDPQSGPSYKKGQEVPFKLEVKNPTNNNISSDLWVKIYERNEILNSNVKELNLGNYTFSPLETKEINIKLTETSSPESYLVVFSFLDNQKRNLSGDFSGRYVIEGPSSKIMGTQVQDSNNGTVDYVVSIAGPADGSIIKNATINVILKDKSNGNIIAQKSVTSDLGAGILKVTIPLVKSSNDFSNYIVETDVTYNGQKLDSNSLAGNTLSNVTTPNNNNSAIINTSGTSNNNDYNAANSLSSNNITVNNNTNKNNSSNNLEIKDIAYTPFKDAVESLAKEGIVKGYEDGTFRGYNNITRAEFATMMCYLLKRDNENANYQNKNRFPDVTSKHWGAGFVNIANEAGLMTGYPDGNFKPDQNITYAEVLTVMVRIINGGKEIKSNLDWPYN